MAKLATCPGCTTQLALPEDATLSDRARCPRCFEEFLLMETVQFSIPTAEILGPAEPETFTPSETLSPGSYVPKSDPYAPEAAEFSEAPFDSCNNEDASEPKLASEPLPSNATLSDWEARLKRAIASDVDDYSSDEAAGKPIFEIGVPTPQPSRSAEPVTYEPQDFEVPDTDLLPESAPIASVHDDGVKGSPDEVDEDVTVKVTGDQTVSELPGLSQINDLPQAIRTEAASARKKRKRSPLRTLASASLGVVGIPLGLYALLWLRGPNGDLLHIAQYLPSFMLPAEFQEPGHRVTNEQLVREPTERDTSEPTDALAIDDVKAEQAPDPVPLIREDSDVAPASAELPAYQGPTFDLVAPAEFAELLVSARQSAPQLSAGDLSSKESVASKGQAYISLARLANKMSFLSQSLNSPIDIANAQAAEQLIATTLRDENVQRDLPQIALRWWQYTDRPSHGIVFIGEVKRLTTTDAGTLAYVSLGGASVTPDIPVLLGRADHREGDVIGIAGTIESSLPDRVPLENNAIGAGVISHYSFALETAGSEPSEGL